MPLRQPTDTLCVGDKVTLDGGSHHGLVGWVSATPDTPNWNPAGIAPGHVGIDFEDGVRCIMPTWRVLRA